MFISCPPPPLPRLHGQVTLLSPTMAFDPISWQATADIKIYALFVVPLAAGSASWDADVFAAASDLTVTWWQTRGQQLSYMGRMVLAAQRAKTDNPLQSLCLDRDRHLLYFGDRTGGIGIYCTQHFQPVPVFCVRQKQTNKQKKKLRRQQEEEEEQKRRNAEE